MGTSVGLDVGVMWRLSEDLNVARRLAARVQQQQSHHHHHHSIHSHRSVASSMIYNGNLSVFWRWMVSWTVPGIRKCTIKQGLLWWGPVDWTGREVS